MTWAYYYPHFIDEELTPGALQLMQEVGSTSWNAAPQCGSRANMSNSQPASFRACGPSAERMLAQETMF